MQHTIRFLTMSLFILVLLAHGALAGNLEPQAPPDSTMKTLDQVQPCTPIQRLASSETATYVIEAPGSYYLTGNITGESGKHGISVEADNVTIDLKGFSLIGVAGSQSGIRFDSGTIGGAVRDGTIRLWGGRGIDAEELVTCRVAAVTCGDNGSDGIRLGTDGLATDCVVRGNDEWGIYGNDNCLIVRCVAHENGSGGFRLYSGGSIKNCVAERTGPAGILVNYESTVENCLSSFNGSGIVISNEGCQVRNNSCVSNYDHGILLQGTRSLIESNMIATRDAGDGVTVTGSAGPSLMVRNIVSVKGSATAFVIDLSAGVSYGPIVHATGGDFSGITNANHPLANIVY